LRARELGLVADDRDGRIRETPPEESEPVRDTAESLLAWAGRAKNANCHQEAINDVQRISYSVTSFLAASCGAIETLHEMPLSGLDQIDLAPLRTVRCTS